MTRSRLTTALVLVVATAVTVTAIPALADDSSEFRVVGYLPNYRAADVNLESLRGLTDLVVFSAQASGDGTLDTSLLTSMPWSKLQQFKTQHRVRLILCVGGWERSAGFPDVALSAVKQKAFAQSALRTCLEQRLDGIDLDWEHPKTEAEQKGYADLLTDLKQTLKPKGLLVSVTMAAWQKLPAAGFQAVDSVQIMAYDHNGRHSTLEGAQADVRTLRNAGVPPEKLVLGVPFYGRNVQKQGEAMTWREIVEKHHPAASSDEVNGFYFNGPATIKKKVDFARKSRLAGVMIWEVGQDAPGKDSLLKVIREAAR